jgi:hypothetical protein
LRPLLNCDWLRVDRFNTINTSNEALADYLDAGEAERILLNGAKRVRLAARTKAGPKHVSDRPTFMLLSEWTDKPVITDIGTMLAKRLRNDVSDQSVFVGYRVYPWPDKPELRVWPGESRVIARA